MASGLIWKTDADASRFRSDFCLLSSLSITSQVSYITMATNTLHYDVPARNWNEALPLGNGRLGAMVFGGVPVERFQINEETLWSGHPKDCNNPAARDVLPQVREAVFAGDYARADALTRRMQGPFYQAYLPLGDLSLAFEHTGEATGYHRALDLAVAAAQTSYVVDGVHFKRTAFVSAPHNLLVVGLIGDRPGALTLAVNLDSPLPFHVETTTSGALLLTGKAPSHSEPLYRNVEPSVVFGDEGMTFAARWKCGHVEAGSSRETAAFASRTPMRCCYCWQQQPATTGSTSLPLLRARIRWT